MHAARAQNETGRATLGHPIVAPLRARWPAQVAHEGEHGATKSVSRVITPSWHATVFAFLRRRAISPQSCQIGEHARNATARTHDHHDCCAGDVRRCVRSDPLSHPLDCHSHTPTGAAGARPGDWPPPRPASFGSAARATRPPRQPPVSAARSNACRRSLHRQATR